MRPTLVRRLPLVVLVLALAACTSTSANPAAPPAPRVVVPSLTAGYLTNIEARICAAGLHPVIVYAPHVTHGDAGLNGYAAMSASPPAGARVAPGSVVRLKLGYDANGGGIEARAARVTTVPDVLGKDVDHAVMALNSHDFTIDITVRTPADGLTILSETPASGTRLARHHTVRLIAGSMPGGACALTNR